MTSIYKYRFSRTTLYWTIVYLAVFAGLGWGLYHLYEAVTSRRGSRRSSWP